MSRTHGFCLHEGRRESGALGYDRASCELVEPQNGSRCAFVAVIAQTQLCIRKFLKFESGLPRGMWQSRHTAGGGEAG
jgi:hypothetical protein